MGISYRSNHIDSVCFTTMKAFLKKIMWKGRNFFRTTITDYLWGRSFLWLQATWQCKENKLQLVIYAVQLQLAVQTRRKFRLVRNTRKKAYTYLNYRRWLFHFSWPATHIYCALFQESKHKRTIHLNTSKYFINTNILARFSVKCTLYIRISRFTKLNWISQLRWPPPQGKRNITSSRVIFQTIKSTWREPKWILVDTWGMYKNKHERTVISPVDKVLWMITKYASSI